MRIGFALPQFGGAADQVDQVAGFARGIEAMGGDGLWVGDRLLAPVNPTVGYGGGTTIPEAFHAVLDPFVLMTIAATDPQAFIVKPLGRVRQLAEEAGRDPASIGAVLRVYPTETGTVEQCTEVLLRAEAEAGIEQRLRRPVRHRRQREADGRARPARPRPRPPGLTGPRERE